MCSNEFVIFKPWIRDLLGLKRPIPNWVWTTEGLQVLLLQGHHTKRIELTATSVRVERNTGRKEIERASVHAGAPRSFGERRRGLSTRICRQHNAGAHEGSAANHSVAQGEQEIALAYGEGVPHFLPRQRRVLRSHRSLVWIHPQGPLQPRPGISCVCESGLMFEFQASKFWFKRFQNSSYATRGSVPNIKLY